MPAEVCCLTVKVGKSGFQRIKPELLDKFRKAEAVIKARLAATEAGRPKAEPAPGSLEYQALHPEWKPSEE